MSSILALGSDAFVLIIMWRARTWVFGRRQGMFETDGDVALRRWAGIAVWIIGVLAIVADHLFL